MQKVYWLFLIWDLIIFRYGFFLSSKTFFKCWLWIDFWPGYLGSKKPWELTKMGALSDPEEVARRCYPVSAFSMQDENIVCTDGRNRLVSQK